MVNQRTLNSSFSLTGKGLHTGQEVSITFHPAPANHGYKIRRIDIENQPVIDALAENVCSTQRGTVLSQNGATVGTVEHALAALYACEIDNCLIDVNASEFPIMDGSSIVYVSKIKETGIQTQNAERKYLCIERRKIKVFDKETGASLMLVPDDSLKIDVSISYDSVFLKRQKAQMNDLSEFTHQFASSRTFVFVKELEGLLSEGLIKGGDLDNAIVIYDNVISQENCDKLTETMGIKKIDSSKLGYIMNKPLLYGNEPARHKILDIVGDIALVGCFLKGKIIANCPGHKINNMLARAIRECVMNDKKLRNMHENILPQASPVLQNAFLFNQ